MRKPHYWRAAAPRSTPSEIVVFDCETWHGAEAECPGGELQTLRLGCALAYRLESGKRTRQQWITFRAASEFWAFVFHRLSRHRPVWVFAHNASYDLGCVAGWSFILGSDYRVTKAAVNGSIFYVKGYVGDCCLVLADTCNYYHCPLASIGRSVGLPKLDMPDQSAPDSEWETYCRRDVEVAAAGVDQLISFVRENKLGPWQPSIAGLAFSAYRARYMTHQVLVHDNWRALKLERSAYYGGLVDCPVVGRRIAGPIYELDVCSMYPALCRDPLPSKLKGYSERCGVRAVRNRIEEGFQVIGDVTLETDEPYPIRLKRGTYYPVGRFRTSLAHAELVYALERGHVKGVHALAWYWPQTLFRSYMGEFAGLKIRYEHDKNDAFRTLSKYYMNSLYGKTGQESPRWRQWGREALQHLEHIHGLPLGYLAAWYDSVPSLYEPEELIRLPGIPDALEVRNYWGIVEVRVGEGESRDSCPAIAACVTSASRQLLRSYQRVAGAGHWYYSDTDSIWVDQCGLDHLTDAGMVRSQELGYLDCKAVHEWIEVHGPKDYETNLTLKRKGVRGDATPEDDGGWGQLHFPSALTQLHDRVTDGVYVRHVVKHLQRTMHRVAVGEDGETRPLRFPQENPELVAGRAFPCLSPRKNGRS